MKVTLVSGDAGIVLNDLPVMIGRNHAADVCLDDAGTGEFQCIIEQDDDGLSIADIAGGLGTFVNGRRITKTALLPGDRLGVGKSDFTVQYQLQEPNPADLHPAIQKRQGRHESSRAW